MFGLWGLLLILSESQGFAHAFEFGFGSQEKRVFGGLKEPKTAFFLYFVYTTYMQNWCKSWKQYK